MTESQFPAASNENPSISSEKDSAASAFKDLAKHARGALSTSRIAPEEGRRLAQKVKALMDRGNAVAFGGGRYLHANAMRRAMTGQKNSGANLVAAPIAMRMWEDVAIDEKMGVDAIDLTRDDVNIADKKSFGGFSRLPLFFPGHVADEWAKTGWRKAVESIALSKADTDTLLEEATRMAAGWEKDRDCLGINKMIEADDTPRQKAWLAWYGAASLETIQEILEFSTETLRLLALEEEFSTHDFPAQNTALIGERLGLSAEERRVWGLWLSWSSMADSWYLENATVRFGNWCNENVEPQKIMWSVFERAIGAKEGVLATLFSAQSALVKAGLLRERSPENEVGQHGSVSVWAMTGMLNAASHKLYQEASSPEELMGRFVHPVRTPKAMARAEKAAEANARENPDDGGSVVLGEASGAEDGIWRVKDFSWADKEASAALTALRSGVAVKILLWGPPGVGKTELSQALAKEAGLALCAPTPPSAWEHKNKDIEIGALRLEAVAAADRMTPGLGACAILVDECEVILMGDERKARIIECLEAAQAPQIWVANSLSKIHPATLRRFDFVARIEPMPIGAREDLAKKMFPSADLALRAAQALKTPAELAQARDWCAVTNNWTWENISLLLSGRQKAVAAIESEKKDGDFVIKTVIPEGETDGLSLVAGYSEVKKAARELIDFFREPERYKALGAVAPRGALLVGPPGSGKTLFTRALSQEAMAPLLLVSSSELAGSPDRIGALFVEARRRAPCIVFIDEVDVLIGDTRDNFGIPNVDKQKILNRLLSEMDGFETLDGVLVIGATHNTSNLDAAATRSGRFGQTIEFREPTHSDRVAILRQGLKKVKTLGELHYDTLALASSGFSGADLSQAINTAALAAAREHCAGVTHEHVSAAFDQVVWGDANGAAMTEETRQRVCVHECGHALLTLAAGLRVQRMTVRPRKAFWGAVWPRGEEGDGLFGLPQTQSRIMLDLAGLAAEEIIYGFADAGASSDLRSASKYAHKAITQWGLSKTLGLSAIHERESANMSDLMAARIEAERGKMLEEGRQGAKDFLLARRKLLLDMSAWIREKKEANWSEVQAWVEAWMASHPDAESVMPVEPAGAERMSKLPLSGVPVSLVEPVSPSPSVSAAATARGRAKTDASAVANSAERAGEPEEAGVATKEAAKRVESAESLEETGMASDGRAAQESIARATLAAAAGFSDTEGAQAPLARDVFFADGQGAVVSAGAASKGEKDASRVNGGKSEPAAVLSEASGGRLTAKRVAPKRRSRVANDTE